MRNPSLFAFFRSVSLILDEVQPTASFLLESFAIGVCCEMRLNRINKEALVAMERWSGKWRKEEDAVAAGE
jgi:hypothetical protein